MTANGGLFTPWIVGTPYRIDAAIGSSRDDATPQRHYASAPGRLCVCGEAHHATQAGRVPDPSPMALCEVCGNATSTPPECESCAARDEAEAKRRGDRP